jgi:asparagine synthase (glutamine-hydrolysing)
LADHNLNYTDKMGMAAGVEIRVPFLDPELVSLAARLPVKQKQRGSCGKWILKEAMRGILPNELIDRPKTGFGAPVRHWLRNELREMLDEAVGPQSKLSNHLELASVRDLIVDDRDGRIDAAYPLFSVLAIESWIRQFVPSRAMVAA